MSNIFLVLFSGREVLLILTSNYHAILGKGTANLACAKPLAPEEALASGNLMQ